MFCGLLKLIFRVIFTDKYNFNIIPESIFMHALQRIFDSPVRGRKNWNSKNELCVFFDTQRLKPKLKTFTLVRFVPGKEAKAVT